MEREKSFPSAVSAVYGSLQISLQFGFHFFLHINSAHHNSTIKTYFRKKKIRITGSSICFVCLGSKNCD